MLMLFGLLLAVLVPTTQELWTLAVSDSLLYVPATHLALYDPIWIRSLDLPTRCMWPGKASYKFASSRGDKYGSPDAVMSYVFIIVSSS